MSDDLPARLRSAMTYLGALHSTTPVLNDAVARIAALEATGRRVMDCWNDYHGDLGSQQPGAQKRADEIDWPALNLAMEALAEILEPDE